ncbi:ABC transporter permease [Thalassospira alkalitolerans]|uniref:ABC transporter permease n=1 Tax=Thalassospira alkalitolerans TaxID=1293890 RepID=A0A1Y2LDV6_9PROT|nr:ABC transporter permease subunit [Thalassospira alkalitolerans]OSQ48702.1 ABC transporter permease [Thalassospira alkalitolerans]|tara:strand:+ start:160596 stop:161342 length:747 start_codon:yes stop_codon:yes gene_type:complete
MFEDLIYVLTKYDSWLWQGFLLTIQLLAVSVVFGSILAIPLAIARVSKLVWVQAVPFAFIYVFRGTPLIAQLFMMYYGCGQLISNIDGIQDHWTWTYLRDPYWYCLLTFVLNTAAYMAEIMRGGIQNVPNGEIEAARACGMTPFTTYRRIIFPRMWQIIWPAYTNDVIFTLKATSLASTVTMMELTGAARKIVARTALPYEAFISAGVIYLIIVYFLTFGFKGIEKYLRRNERREGQKSGPAKAGGTV